MHGSHPFDGPIRLWWGHDRDALDPFVSGAAQAPPSLFLPIGPDQMFRAGGLISEAGVVVDRNALHALMGMLARRIGREWSRLATIDEATHRRDIPDNEDMPAGYTYLLQFIAHDLVDTARSMTVRGGAVGALFDNARARPLRLDTLYGAGPDESPHAYAFGGRQADGHGFIPRTHLRLGPSYPGSSGAFCPARDIARGGRPRSDYTGRVGTIGNQLSAPQPPQATGDQRAIDQGAGVDWDVLSEPQLADARNDSHALISQFTVLFQLLHNHIVDLLKPLTAGATNAQRERTQRRFTCARAVTEIIYRQIVATDMLPKILHPAINQRYRDRKPLWTSRWQGVPVEFSFGAFRFAHSISRDAYIVNSALQSGSLEDALLEGSERNPNAKPMASNWMVDWIHFFELGGAADELNLSKRIGPHYAQVLTGESAFPEKAPTDEAGLASRDLLSACYAGLLSVPCLSEKLKGVFDIIDDYATIWPDRIEHWLRLASPEDITPAKAALIAKDPPLPFFVMFEAQSVAEGKRLGPLGSAIVAETVCAALAAASFDFETPGGDLKTSIETCVRTLLQVEDFQAPDRLAGILTMPDLIKYLESENLF